jgi:hypothetical protein
MILARGGCYIRIKGVKKSGHDLVGLARVTNFEASVTELAVLQRLTRFVMAGRYPIPQHWTDQSLITSYGQLLHLSTWHSRWDKHCDAMLSRLKTDWRSDAPLSWFSVMPFRSS